MQRLSTSDVAAYGQRRLKLKDGHIKILHQLAKDGLPVPPGPHTKGAEIKVELALPREEWDVVKLTVMYNALRAKFTLNDELRRQLVATEGHWLVEHTKNDIQWADGEAGHGTNFLGKLLMYVRAEILQAKQFDFDSEFLHAPMSAFLDYTNDS